MALPILSGGGMKRPASKRMLGARTPVGTEAVALKNMADNARLFAYPDPGFEVPIEHSLLYATLAQPRLFPDEVIQKLIAEEDFAQYLPVRPDPKLRGPSGDGGHPGRTSYAQLSAALYLAAEAWPADSAVPRRLCKALLQCVVQYAEAHGLDREAEVRELLAPLVRLNDARAGRNALATLLPMYVGLGAAMVTLNPALLWAGYAIGNYYNIRAAVQDGDRHKKLQAIYTETNRAGDAEQASLLDETDHDHTA